MRPACGREVAKKEVTQKGIPIRPFPSERDLQRYAVKGRAENDVIAG